MQRKTLCLNFSHLAIKIGVQILAAAHLQIHDYLGKVMFFLRV